jgi:hypothetical protein
MKKRQETVPATNNVVEAKKYYEAKEIYWLGLEIVISFDAL